MYVCIYIIYLGQPRELDPNRAADGESTGQGRVLEGDGERWIEHQRRPGDYNLQRKKEGL